MTLSLPGYYRGNPRFGSCDYYFLVDTGSDDGIDWGSYAGPRRLYWGFSVEGDGTWFEAGEQFVSDVFSSSPRYLGGTAPDGIPAFSGDRIATVGDRLTNIQTSVSSTSQVAAADIPGYVADRIRRPMPRGAHVVPGSTPVVAFGDFQLARVATVGINPSKHEFTSKTGDLLAGPMQRLATLESLGIDSLDRASDDHVTEVVKWCTQYFGRNPYRRWFNQLDRIVDAATGCSYYDGTACHLDLVQWATDPVWGQIASAATRQALIDADRAFLGQQLEEENVDIVLFNGSGVVAAVEQSLGIVLNPEAPAVAGALSSEIWSGWFRGKRLVGWSKNLQSSRPMTRALKDAIAVRASEILADT